MLKTKPFPLPLFPHTPTPDRWKRSLYSLLSYRYFFFKSAGLHSFPCDLLPPLHIFILSLLCKAFKYVLNSRPVSALLLHKYVFNIYLAASDLGLPLPYFLFLSLSTPTQKYSSLLCLWVLVFFPGFGVCFCLVGCLFYNIICLCSSLPSCFSTANFLSYFSALSSFLPRSIASPLLVFWCSFCSVLSICLSDIFPLNS